uniref:Partial AB-hydrolase lipase domain-containing protein n=1 Tax=Chromera velia CCMP2878 TaxID=1169474 RepID=A0A0G4FNE6_9ALVE|eukprot:Cvel_17950.t1-p1 / transcript=Cvel_17950.t1 / gene=Cvel_17950 / organism=Chromera_velia_CCMP2878 / gene_product=Lipase 1, putative / transcript_product=Lipase 1, putative / location=Cvel_scaffold1459:31517-36472(+) / protein_length=571 / sequence_SO=supercontig / SO=protein_coding / is_pseudo=false
MRGLLLSLALLLGARANTPSNQISGSEQDSVQAFRDFVVDKMRLPFEVYDTTTEDGFIIKMFRIPREDSPAILIMHGLADSSWSLVLGNELSAVRRAYEAGFDVWLGNHRGNVFAREHKKFSRGSADIWNHNVQHIGWYDLPAMIDRVLLESGEKSLVYAGHSQGITDLVFNLCDYKRFEECPKKPAAANLETMLTVDPPGEESPELEKSKEDIRTALETVARAEKECKECWKGEEQLPSPGGEEMEKMVEEAMEELRESQMLEEPMQALPETHIYDPSKFRIDSKKIRAVIALAPAPFPFLTESTMAIWALKAGLPYALPDVLNIKSFPHTPDQMRSLMKTVSKMFPSLACNSVLRLCDKTTACADEKKMEAFLHLFPQPMSVSAWQHYSQWMVEYYNLTAFDYKNETTNVHAYGDLYNDDCDVPPWVDVSTWPKDVPMYIFGMEADLLATPQSVALFRDNLPKEAVKTYLSLKDYGHETIFFPNAWSAHIFHRPWQRILADLRFDWLSDGSFKPKAMPSSERGGEEAREEENDGREPQEIDHRPVEAQAEATEIQERSRSSRKEEAFLQ